jgi:hypothetical protein
MSEGPVHSDDRAVLAVVDDVWGDLRAAAERRLAEPPVHHRSRRVRQVGFGAAAAVVLLGGAATARALLGDPPPPEVAEDLARVDDGMPADLRYDPDVANARSVAADGDAVLYVADLAGGGTCTEVAVAGRPEGAVCETRSRPLEVTIPGTPEDGPGRTVVVAGRVNVEADAVELVIEDGAGRVAPVLRPGGYFIVQLSDRDSAAARHGLRIDALLDGAVAATLDLTAAFEPEPEEPLDPIASELVSDSNDLSLVLGVHGSVQVDGAVTIRLVFPDGGQVESALDARHRYDLEIAADRRDDFADSPGQLVALDAGGQELARRSVAAVSYWRAHELGD